MFILSSVIVAMSVSLIGQLIQFKVWFLYDLGYDLDSLAYFKSLILLISIGIKMHAQEIWKGRGLSKLVN